MYEAPNVKVTQWGQEGKGKIRLLEDSKDEFMRLAELK